MEKDCSACRIRPWGSGSGRDCSRASPLAHVLKEGDAAQQLAVTRLQLPRVRATRVGGLSGATARTGLESLSIGCEGDSCRDSSEMSEGLCRSHRRPGTEVWEAEDEPHAPAKPLGPCPSGGLVLHPHKTEGGREQGGDSAHRHHVGACLSGLFHLCHSNMPGLKSSPKVLHRDTCLPPAIAPETPSLDPRSSTHLWPPGSETGLDVLSPKDREGGRKNR